MPLSGHFAAKCQTLEQMWQHPPLGNTPVVFCRPSVASASVPCDPKIGLVSHTLSEWVSQRALKMVHLGRRIGEQIISNALTAAQGCGV